MKVAFYDRIHIERWLVNCPNKPGVSILKGKAV